jgi:hypothetical protein
VPYLPLARMEVPSNCPVNEFFAGGPLGPGSNEVRVTVTLGGLTETWMSMVRLFDVLGRPPSRAGSVGKLQLQIEGVTLRARVAADCSTSIGAAPQPVRPCHCGRRAAARPVKCYWKFASAGRETKRSLPTADAPPDRCWTHGPSVERTGQIALATDFTVRCHGDSDWRRVAACLAYLERTAAIADGER